MLFRSTFPSLLALLLVPACGGDPSVAVDSPSTDASPVVCPASNPGCVLVASPPKPTDSCLDDQWVLIQPGGLCADINATAGFWSGAPLFDSLKPIPTGGLEDYCVYRWTSNGAPPDVAELHQSGNATAFSPDCVVAAAASSVGLETFGAEIAHQFLKQLDATTPLPASSDGDGLPRVRVAVVDSTPDGFLRGEALTGRFDHGFKVARLIRELACPEGTKSCRADVSHHLALPMVDPDTLDWKDGGYFGRLSHLARAIYHALSAEQEYDRLVVNLSLGWEGRFGGAFYGNDPSDLEPAVRAVYRSLQVVACSGALIVAAAGNHNGGPRDTIGPLYPAAWESKRGPTFEECKRYGYTLPNETTAKWIHSVGAVDGSDHPIGSTRLEGRPRLAAPGQGATVRGTSGRALSPFTGTSAASAAVSGMAAVVWSYRPKLAANDVVNVLYGTGQPLNALADYCGESGCVFADSEIRRVQLCPALRAACQAGEGRCPEKGFVSSCLDRGSFVDQRTRLARGSVAYLASHATRRESAVNFDRRLPAIAACGDEPIFSSDATSYPQHPCPRSQYYESGAAPRNGPQPPENPCGLCSFGLSLSASTVVLEIDPTYRGTVEDPVLHVDGIGNYVLPSGTLRGGDRHVVEDVPVVGFSTRATLSFRVVDDAGRTTGSVESPVLLEAP